MFSIVVRRSECGESSRFSLAKLVAVINERKRMLVDERVEIEPHLYDAYLQKREAMHNSATKATHPTRTVEHHSSTLFADTWYLAAMDERYRRYYAKTPSPRGDKRKERVLEALSQHLREFVDN